MSDISKNVFKTFLSSLQFCKSNNRNVDHDENWSNIYRKQQVTPMYKWIKDKTEGSLVDIYDKNGAEGIISFAHEQIAPMLYNDGQRVETIQKSEYMKFKNSMAVNKGNIIDTVPKEMTTKFVPHTAQWRLNKRGTDSETLIHLLLNRGDPKSTEIAKIIIEEYPGLALDVYESDDLFGQSSLHIAIVQGENDCVDFLLEKGAHVNQRAIGSFFLPEDQKTKPPKKRTNFEGFAYYGEYPLAFAASFGNKDIYDSLIEYGANPNCQDSFGNSVLHMCVINNSTEMYSYAVKHWAKPADVNVMNIYGQTPLTLATKLGRQKIFEDMLDLMKVEFWRFSDMACSGYPLIALDTINPDGTTSITVFCALFMNIHFSQIVVDWGSALMTIIHGNKPEHMEMIGGEVVKRLLDYKWKTYGYKRMYERLLFLLLHLLCMSIGIYLRPKQEHNLLEGNTVHAYIRYVAEIITCISCAVFVFFQQGKELKAEGVKGFVKSLPAAPEKGIFLFANVLILLCIPLRILNYIEIEEAFLVIALPSSWIFLLFFARGISLTGPFVQIIYSMIVGDVLRFAIIASIFFIGFSQAFYFVGKDMKDRQRTGLCSITLEDRVIDSYSNLFETGVTLLRSSLGSYEYDDFTCAHYISLIKIMSVVFMFMMPLMLVNMLIAMMGNTYNMIISKAEKAYRQQWAKTIIVLERALSKEMLIKYQEKYSIEISRDHKTGISTRGLMVMVQTKKTKARQRNSAISNWKRIVRKFLRQTKPKEEFVKRSDTVLVQEVLDTITKLDSMSSLPFSTFNIDVHPITEDVKAEFESLNSLYVATFDKLSSLKDDGNLAEEVEPKREITTKKNGSDAKQNLDQFDNQKCPNKERNEQKSVTVSDSNILPNVPEKKTAHFVPKNKSPLGQRDASE